MGFLIVLVIGVQTITSCSGGDADDLPCVTCGDDGGDNNGEGTIRTYDIKDDTGSSFTIRFKEDYCQEDGTLKEDSEEKVINYRINGTTLSFGGIDFSGNSASLIGTWTREPFSTSCEDVYLCYEWNGISKAVFTQNSLIITECAGGREDYEYEDFDGIITKWKVIDCGTVEWTEGTETVIIKYSGTVPTVTYKGKTCKAPLEYSKSQMEKACKEAHDNNGDYYEILNKEMNDCLKDNNFPEWVH